jgi:hypothetical protein
MFWPFAGNKLNGEVVQPCALKRPKQERAEANSDAGLVSQPAHPHGRWIGIGRGEIKPEIEHWRIHLLILCPIESLRNKLG